MLRTIASAAARTLRAVCISASLLVMATFTYAEVSSSAPVAAAGTATPGPGKQIPAPKTGAKPLWTELTPAQQQALAPLAADWDQMSVTQKKKWLEIGNKFPSLKPDEQLRMQERMREWIKLTPEQRRVARENYARSKTLNADQKSAQWQQYQQLPEEQKKKLAAAAASKKQVANLPPASQKAPKTVPTLKSASRPMLEKSVKPQPQAVNTLAPVPSEQPATK